MRYVGPVIKRCDLPGCELQAYYISDDGRFICRFHERLAYRGQQIVEKNNDDKLDDFNPENF